MRIVSVSLALLAAILSATRVEGFAAQRPRDSKTNHLAQREHQQIARNGKTGPDAKHHTYREEVPGKHKETAWFQPPAHKKKVDHDDEKQKPSGREWTYGKVPRF